MNGNDHARIDLTTDRLVAEIGLYREADYHDASAIAGSIEDLGYGVDHVVEPEDDQPHLYVMAGDG